MLDKDRCSGKGKGMTTTRRDFVKLTAGVLALAEALPLKRNPPHYLPMIRN